MPDSLLRTANLKITDEEAASFGVQGGIVPSDADTAGRVLLQWRASSPWCAPLVVAGDYETCDFTKGYDPNRPLKFPYSLGRYDEDRVGMYETSLFKSGEDPRTIHVGIDIGAAEGTPVFAPTDAVLRACEILTAPGDYGGTIILESVRSPEVSGDQSLLTLFMLFGHLSHVSVRRLQGHDGLKFKKGDLMGWLGAKSENGGWNPHLHWQLSWLRPLRCDLPGAVTKKNRALARLLFPDPTPSLRSAIAGLKNN